MRYDWKSKKLYRMAGHVGNVAYIERIKKYVLVSRSGVVFIIDQKFAEQCFNIESRINRTLGRPVNFPGKKTESRLITLPVETWKRIGEPASLKIAEVIDAKGNS
jgi:hypothetical protein